MIYGFHNGTYDVIENPFLGRVGRSLFIGRLFVVRTQRILTKCRPSFVTCKRMVIYDNFDDLHLPKSRYFRSLLR